MCYNLIGLINVLNLYTIILRFKTNLNSVTYGLDVMQLQSFSLRMSLNCTLYGLKDEICFR